MLFLVLGAMSISFAEAGGNDLPPHNKHPIEKVAATKDPSKWQRLLQKLLHKNSSLSMKAKTPHLPQNLSLASVRTPTVLSEDVQRVFKPGKINGLLQTVNSSQLKFPKEDVPIKL